MQTQAWPSPRVERLTSIWSSTTLGYKEVAADLNTRFPDYRPVSGDAVLKKAKTLGLPARPAKHIMAHAKPRSLAYMNSGFRPLMRGKPHAPRWFDDTADAAAVPVERRCQLWELERDRCHWPFGEPGTEGFFFCNDVTASDARYCRHHMAKSGLGRVQLTQTEIERLQSA